MFDELFNDDDMMEVIEGAMPKAAAMLRELSPEDRGRLAAMLLTDDGGPPGCGRDAQLEQ